MTLYTLETNQHNINIHINVNVIVGAESIFVNDYPPFVVIPITTVANGDRRTSSD